MTVLPLRCIRTTWQLIASRRRLAGAQLYDLLCALLLFTSVALLSFVRPGVIYYWMKDITSEFLKIQVIFTALEILDKVWEVTHICMHCRALPCIAVHCLHIRLHMRQRHADTRAI